MFATLNAVASYFSHLLSDNPQRWYPLLSVYYLTYSCNLRCVHCSDGAGKPYHTLSSDILPASKVLELFRRIRRHSDYLVITGGEPLDHPEIDAILEGTAEIGFRGVILTTSGINLVSHLKSVSRSVTDLVISLQTLDSSRADHWYGRGEGVHARVLAAIDAADALKDRDYKIILSSVVTPENIPDLKEVHRFAQARGFRLAACPQLMGVKAHESLQNNPAYREFFDFLISEKRRGAKLQGTVDYLEYMRDLAKFDCRPFTMLVVSPLGDVAYPCLELGHPAGNLFETEDLHALRIRGESLYGPQPKCDTRCHSACALGFSRLLASPGSALHEGWLEARSWLRPS